MEATAIISASVAVLLAIAALVAHVLREEKRLLQSKLEELCLLISDTFHLWMEAGHTIEVANFDDSSSLQAKLLLERIAQNRDRIEIIQAMYFKRIYDDTDRLLVRMIESQRLFRRMLREGHAQNTDVPLLKELPTVSRYLIDILICNRGRLTGGLTGRFLRCFPLRRKALLKKHNLPKDFEIINTNDMADLLTR